MGRRSPVNTEPDFWTRVLREGGGLKQREFRKFKNELLMPGIVEINAVTEITVELVEHRERSTLRWVQFKVARRPRVREQVPDPADATLAMRAAKIGVREEDMDALVAKYGAMKVAEGLEAMDAQISNPMAGRIHNPGAYLKSFLANRFANAERTAAAPPEEAKPLPKIDEAKEREQLVQAWRTKRVRQVKTEFAAPSESERRQRLERARTHRLFSVFTPAMRRRLETGDWESPLISEIVLDGFATARYGSGWREPTEVDLVMFSVRSEDS